MSENYLHSGHESNIRQFGRILLPVCVQSLGAVRRFVSNQPNLKHHTTKCESTRVLTMAAAEGPTR